MKRGERTPKGIFNVKLVLKTLNNELFQNIPILKKLDNEY
jgi:hypothetical protein